MMEILVPVSVILVLIALNGVFVAAEFAIIAAPYTRLTALAEEGSRAARHVLSIQRDPDQQNRYLATAQVGITIVSLGLGMYGEHVAAEWFLELLHNLGRLAEPLAHTAASILAVGLLTYLHVVLGEMVPKSLALQTAERMVLALEQPMLWMERLLRPLVWVLNAIGNRIVHLLGVQPLDAASRLYSPEELEFIVDESFEVGLLESSERRFIENIFDLSERTVGQIMTPRTRIVGIEVHASLQEVLHRLCETRQTRYPLYEGDLDQVVGILHIKDLARRQAHGHLDGKLGELKRPAVFLPESLTLEKTLLRFRAEGLQIAIVIDEFGGTAGLVTLEDLMEEVVGEIQDEFDQEIPPIEELSEGVLRVRGDLILDELNQLYDLNLEYPQVDTVGGLVMAALGRIPEPGDRVEFDGVSFEVESISGLAVQTILVRLPL